MTTGATHRSTQARRLAGIAAATAVVAATLIAGAGPVMAKDKDHKVTICHATSSAKNPFTINSVDTSSINNLSRGNGHGTHADDVIPPFTDEDGNYYPGQNFSQAAYLACSGIDLGGGSNPGS